MTSNERDTLRAIAGNKPQQLSARMYAIGVRHTTAKTLNSLIAQGMIDRNFRLTEKGWKEIPPDATRK